MPAFAEMLIHASEGPRTITPCRDSLSSCALLARSQRISVRRIRCFRESSFNKRRLPFRRPFLRLVFGNVHVFGLGAHSDNSFALLKLAPRTRDLRTSRRRRLRLQGIGKQHSLHGNGL